MKNYVLFAAIGLLSATGIAVAQQAQPMNQGELNQIDTDKKWRCERVRISDLHEWRFHEPGRQR